MFGKQKLHFTWEVHWRDHSNYCSKWLVNNHGDLVINGSVYTLNKLLTSPVMILQVPRADWVVPSFQS